jgi:hypothetical protein
MSLPDRHRSPEAGSGVPPAASDAIDSLVDAVSAGARPSLSGVSDTAERGVPLTALPRASRGRGMSPLMRRTALAAAAFGVGLALTVWSLRSLESVAVPTPPTHELLPSRALWPPTRMARPQASALTAEDLNATRGLPEIVDTPTPVPLPAPSIGPPVAAPATARASARRSPPPSAPVTLVEMPAETPLAAPPLDAAALVARVPAPVVPLAESPARAETTTTTSGVSVEAAEETAVLGTVQEYERAFEQLDVNATAELWPSVDRRALDRAFASIKSQELALESCAVVLAETTATARCQGTAQYLVKFGGGGARTGRFEWIFRMRKVGNLWKIDGVTAFDQIAASRDQQ